MTKIEWVKNEDGSQGKTWNPVTGCTKVSAGCKHCYAERMAKRLQAMGQPNYVRGFQVTCHPHTLEIPMKRKKPTMWFVCSMSDLFHQYVPDEFIYSVFEVMRQTPQHTYQVLTKRPGRMAKFAVDLLHRNWPPNVWAGTSCEDQLAANTRIPFLLNVPAKVRFLSCEPLLGPIDLARAHPHGYYCDEVVGCVDHPFRTPLHSVPLHWVIVGGESGPGARPMETDWALGLRDQCVAFGVPYFFKQHGGVNKKEAGRLLDGRTWDEMPEVRQ